MRRLQRDAQWVVKGNVLGGKAAETCRRLDSKQRQLNSVSCAAGQVAEDGDGQCAGWLSCRPAYRHCTAGKRLPDGPCQLRKLQESHWAPLHINNITELNRSLTHMQWYMCAAYASLQVWAWTACKSYKALELAAEARAHAQGLGQD